MPLAFAVWARVDDKTLDKILHEDYKIANFNPCGVYFSLVRP
jgi:hemolysin-activating ACP:hemolysin acyltransferase